MAVRLRAVTARRRVYEILELGRVGDKVSRAVDALLVSLIVVNLVAVVLETMPELDAKYARLFFVIEIVSSIVFTVEYALRIWSAVEHSPLRDLKPWRARLKYAMSAPAVIDLLAVIPFWVYL